MSSFKDTFTKEDAKSSVLDYDDAAFGYFAATVLVCILIPWTWIYYKRVLARGKKSVEELSLAKSKKTTTTVDGKKRTHTIARCKCSLCADRLANLAKPDPITKRMFGTKRKVFCFIAWIITWLTLVLVCSTSLSSMKHVATFDPWVILNLQTDATDRQIKKAFRTMSLKYHPDKNKNDASAAAKFLLITKAYNTLTDEIARQNYEKYGNPDGAGLMRVGIGLPKWLIREDAQLFVLALLTFFILVAVPVIFVVTYLQSQRFTASGLKKETVSYIALYMLEEPRPSHIMLLIASSWECRSIPWRPTDAQDLDKLKKHLTNGEGEELFQGFDSVHKALCLLTTYLHRAEEHLTPGQLEDLQVILKYICPITQAMVDVGFVSNWFRVVQSVLHSRRSLIQCLNIGMPPILQLPHTIENVEGTRHLMNELKKEGPNLPKMGLKTVCKRILDNKKNTLAKFNPEQIADIEAFYKILPQVSLKAHIGVVDENEIAVNDMVTCDVEFTRLHLEEGAIAGPIHSPRFPELMSEDWCFFLTDLSNGAIHSCERVRSSERKVNLRLYYRPTSPGVHKISISCWSEVYFGVDETITQEITVVDADQVQRSHFVHPEDVALDNEPNLVQSVLGGPLNPQISDDSSSEDEKEGESSAE